MTVQVIPTTVSGTPALYACCDGCWFVTFAPDVPSLADRLAGHNARCSGGSWVMLPADLAWDRLLWPAESPALAGGV